MEYGRDLVRKNYLLKLSGDLVSDESIELIRGLAKVAHLTICVGGGKQINERFEKYGYDIKFGILGRESETLVEKQMARDVLEMNQALLQDMLESKGIAAEVVIPVMYVGTVMCHVNGDQYILSAYNGFTLIYIATTPERVEAKEEKFKEYDKIKIVGIEELGSKQN